ncbi:4-hydroxythreonine-4-phosphate dehydrogenase PdxA [Microvirga subterranea]|uniref:4-hydroxythreonine-4-phosphate dehydrogenase n=1 Tax=Microvirga subterranea TaxID=186651 RepID=A0A370HLN4_9HYPH|nr:4-hydroxythreonine-4-phosphate dehydrogenase PdxA [Microvirga subterranea]RDI59095.1 4-hydroxythreonine-4-phosphate dehydrogenase [Microvirga subterranea]
MGDPAGISPELAAKLIAAEDFRAGAGLVIFGDLRILEQGAKVAGVVVDVDVVGSEDGIPEQVSRPVFVDLKNLGPDQVKLATATLEGGQFATENFRRALLLAQSGRADAVFFTPFNKKAMRLAYDGYDDEIRFVRDVLKTSVAASEFNVLGKLWNARVTSHIPLSKVASVISEEAILRSLTLADACMRAAGFNPPRIAVAGLNPHAGDGGNFGSEEIEVIEPAVRKAIAKGFAVEGPFPSDTVFLRAKNGDFDAVLTMYHDQGQIAMKLMGFDRGITLIGGFEFPICTPAHGTAYEIAGRGIANLGASREALSLAIRMGAEVRARRAATETETSLAAAVNS